MYCKHCGKEIANDSKFCSFCGGKLDIIIPAETVRKVQIEHDLPSDQTPKFKSANTESPKFVEEKYDPYYETNNSEAVFIGVISLVLVFIYTILNQSNLVSSEVTQALVIGLVVFRLIAIAWCVGLAKEKNSNNYSAGFLAFFIPGISLIYYGRSRKLLLPYNYKRKSNPEKSLIDNHIANHYLNNDEFEKALYYANRSVKLYSANHFALDTRGQIKYNLNDYLGALHDFEESIKIAPDSGHGMKYHNRGCTKRELNDMKGACEDWKIAYNLGYKKDKEYIEKYCNTN